MTSAVLNDHFETDEPEPSLNMPDETTFLLGAMEESRYLYYIGARCQRGRLAAYLFYTHRQINPSDISRVMSYLMEIKGQDSPQPVIIKRLIYHEPGVKQRCC